MREVFPRRLHFNAPLQECTHKIYISNFDRNKPKRYEIFTTDPCQSILSVKTVKEHTGLLLSQEIVEVDVTFKGFKTYDEYLHHTKCHHKISVRLVGLNKYMNTKGPLEHKIRTMSPRRLARKMKQADVLCTWTINVSFGVVLPSPRHYLFVAPETTYQTIQHTLSQLIEECNENQQDLAVQNVSGKLHDLHCLLASVYEETTKRNNFYNKHLAKKNTSIKSNLRIGTTH